MNFAILPFFFQTLTLMLTLATACLAANLPMDVELPQGRVRETTMQTKYLHLLIDCISLGPSSNAIYIFATLNRA